MKQEEQLKNIFKNFFNLRKQIKTKDIKQDKIKKWDSLSHMNLIFTIEEEFKIKFSDKEILISKDYFKILKIVKKKRNA